MLIRALAVLLLALTALPAVAQTLSGPAREEFIVSGLDACADNVRREIVDDAEGARRRGVAAHRVGLFCRCQMEFMADVMTLEELRIVTRDGLPDSWTVLLNASVRLCLPTLSTAPRP
ncbi:hypothetical protein [Plastoroseomonas arctica]|uniref:Uncharacterized protein n=1 Tax=Plastoroseomonas arctica TaxID=1509237 RepID=A0AAF1K6J5_9PROT|nr:hypothetical protein [Plastoroseomonas arctica]MBR0657519.1 hypothetical protein [Plastoroseomonas arctica]